MVFDPTIISWLNTLSIIYAIKYLEWMNIFKSKFVNLTESVFLKPDNQRNIRYRTEIIHSITFKDILKQDQLQV